MIKATLMFNDGMCYDLAPTFNQSIPHLFTKVLNMMFNMPDLKEVDVMQDGDTIRQYTKVDGIIESYDLRHRTIKEWKMP